MAAEKNPAEAYLAEKTAVSFMGGLRAGTLGQNPGRLGAQMGKGLTGAAMVAGGTAAIGAVGAGVQMLYDAATKARDFRAMLEVNPDLATEHEKNPRLFNQMFSTLRTFNPSFSKDPLVAGSYMREMSMDPLNAGGKVVDALNFRDKMPQGMGAGVAQGARGGFSTGVNERDDKKKKRGPK